MKGDVDLRVGNGARVAALEIGDFELTLPSGLVILLKNCYYIPAVSVSPSPNSLCLYIYNIYEALFIIFMFCAHLFDECP